MVSFFFFYKLDVKDQIKQEYVFGVYVQVKPFVPVKSKASIHILFTEEERCTNAG